MSVADYHLWAIPCAVKDWTGDIAFTELENDLSDGFYASVLFGSENGLRTWSLTLPTLQGGTLSPAVTGINGESLTYEQYVWDLYCEHKVTGTPFAYQDIRTSQYYLVKFADPKLSYQRMLTKLYSTGINLKQVRIEDETVFDVSKISGAYWASDQQEFDGPFSAGFWDASGGGGSGLLSPLYIHGNVNDTGTQNGLRTVQFNVGGTNDGYLLSDDDTMELREAFLVMKMREATFSNNAGVLTGPDLSYAPALIGDTGTTKFFNSSLGSDFEYRLNGVLYAESNQQAPMNTFGIVHVRKPTGFLTDEVQLGRDRNLAGRYAEMDLAELLLFAQVQPRSLIREIMEYLATKWGITT